MDNRRLKGALGEQAAARYLREKGYELISANYKTKFGEIDIIVKKDDYIVFVEVKTRQLNTLVAPYLAVNEVKQKKIIQTASSFIKSNQQYSKFSYRFDIIEIFTDGLKVVNVNHLENAYIPLKRNKLFY